MRSWFILFARLWHRTWSAAPGSPWVCLFPQVLEPVGLGWSPSLAPILSCTSMCSPSAGRASTEKRKGAAGRRGGNEVLPCLIGDFSLAVTIGRYIGRTPRFRHSRQSSGSEADRGPGCDQGGLCWKALSSPVQVRRSAERGMDGPVLPRELLFRRAWRKPLSTDRV